MYRFGVVLTFKSMFKACIVLGKLLEPSGILYKALREHAGSVFFISYGAMITPSSNP